MKHHKPTVIFSLEMSKIEIMMRLFSAEASVALGSMRSGHMSDQDWTRLARRSSELAEAPLFIDDSPNLTMMEIRAKARRLRQRHDLQLIVIDYMQLMTSGKRVESRQQEVSEFSRAMKLLAKELDVPVVALSQLNRGPEQRTDKKPMLSDLRESGSIEQDSDMVLLVHRPDLYEPETERARRGGHHHRQAPQRPDRDRCGGLPGPVQPLRRHAELGRVPRLSQAAAARALRRPARFASADGANTPEFGAVRPDRECKVRLLDRSPLPNPRNERPPDGKRMRGIPGATAPGIPSAVRRLPHEQGAAEVVNLP